MLVHVCTRVSTLKNLLCFLPISSPTKMFPPKALTTLLTIWFLFISLVIHILPVQHLISFEITCNSLIVVSLYNTLPSDKRYGNMSSAIFPSHFKGFVLLSSFIIFGNSGQSVFFRIVSSVNCSFRDWKLSTLIFAKSSSFVFLGLIMSSKLSSFSCKPTVFLFLCFLGCCSFQLCSFDCELTNQFKFLVWLIVIYPHKDIRN